MNEKKQREKQSTHLKTVARSFRVPQNTQREDLSEDIVAEILSHFIAVHQLEKMNRLSLLFIQS